MIEASRHNPSWDKILVYDSSRLFRNSTDAAHYKTELHDRGIEVISIKEKFPHTTIGWFMEKFTDIVNEFYSRQTRLVRLLRPMAENIWSTPARTIKAAYVRPRIYGQTNWSSTPPLLL